MATEAMIAHVLVSKFGDSLPLVSAGAKIPH
jgi:hypothetical protein